MKHVKIKTNSIPAYIKENKGSLLRNSILFTQQIIGAFFFN